MSVQSKNTKLNIGILLDDSLDMPDGVQQYVVTIGEHFRALGHTVHYLVAETHRLDLDNVHSLAKLVHIRFNGNTVRTPLSSSRDAMRALLSEIKLDVLHVQMPFSPFFAAKVIRMVPQTCKVVGTWHTFPSSSFHFVSNVVLSGAIRRTLRRVEVTIGVSEATARFADKAYGTKSIVIPNAVNLQAFSKRSDRHTSLVRKLLFLGRFVERKGPLHMINAIQELKKRGYDMNRLEIVMAGKGPLLEQSRLIAAKVGLHISFPGFIDENKKADLLATADVAVFPSTGGEAFGISVVEAMATGSAVVLGGDNAGYRSILGDLPGQLFNPDDVTIFADTLLQYLKVYGEERQKIIDDQLALIEQYDVSVVCERLLRVYTS